MLRNMWLPALLVTTFMVYAVAESNVTSDVEAFVSKFRELNETVDVLDSLEKIGEHSKELFRLGRPIGNLLRAFNATGETTIEEENGMIQLNKLFKISHADLAIYMSVAEFGYDAFQKMMPLLSYMDVFTNVAHRSDEKMEQRIRSLKGFMLRLADIDPMHALASIDDSTRVNCRMPAKEGIKRVVRVQEGFRRLENRIRNSWNESEFSQVDYYKNRFMTLASSTATEEEAKTLITTLDKLEINSTSHAAVRTALMMSHFDITGHFGGYGGGPGVRHLSQKETCLLEVTVDENAFNQTVLYSKLSSLHQDLLKVQLLVWATSSLRESEDDYYDKDTGMAVLALERTGPYIAKWTRKVQELIWPEMGIEFAKREIELAPIPLVDFNATANRVQKAFADHGSPDFTYQVLIVPTSEVDVSWSVKCYWGNIYANMTDFNGLDVHVFRFSQSAMAKRAGNARTWVETNKETIVKEIRSGYLSNSSTLLAKLHADSSSIGTLAVNYLYNSVFLLRERISSTSSPMKLGLAIAENAFYKLETSKTSYSVVNQGIETVYSWKALFFL